MTEAPTDQDKKQHDIKSDLKANGDFIMIPKGLTEMGVRGLHLEIYIKLLESNSKFITQEQIASDLDCEVRTVQRAYRLFKTQGMMKGKKLLSRSLWITKPDISVGKTRHQCRVNPTSVSCTIKEKKTVPDFSDTPPPTDTPDQFKKEIEESDIKNGQVLQRNTCDTSYNKYNNEYGEIVANHVHKGYMDKDLPYIRSFIRNVHGLRPFSKSEETAFLTYKDWASDDDNGDYVADRMEYYTRAVEKSLQLHESLSRNGRYIKFNKSFREDFWRI